MALLARSEERNEQDTDSEGSASKDQARSSERQSDAVASCHRGKNHISGYVGHVDFAGMAFERIHIGLVLAVVALLLRNGEASILIPFGISTKSALVIDPPSQNLSIFRQGSAMHTAGGDLDGVKGLG